MLIADIIPKVERELQGEFDEVKQYTPDDLRAAVISGIEELSSLYTQQYVISGAGEVEAITPEPDVYGMMAIILSSAIVLLRRERIKASAVAMTISNASGRTDLSQVPNAFGTAIALMQSRLSLIINAEHRADVESQISAREMTRQATET